ncbi:hypothetical protein GCM10023187_25010 [Nibrella viscosa]|uniref:Membrane protein involved in the export of O-antigen and teichoic acid n=1 Tax=Nibrella viscosa TaxID=1084524 RepID=A0ABP8KG79_9BACT
MLKSYFTNSIWVLGGNLIAKLLNLLTLSALGRILNPKWFGVYNLAYSYAESLSQMADLGTSIVVQRSFANATPQESIKLSARFFGGGLIILGFYCLAFSVYLFHKKYYSPLYLKEYWSVYSIYILFISLGSRLSQFALIPIMGLKDFKAFSIRNVLCTFVVSIFVSLGALKFELLGSLQALLLATVLNVVITFLVFSRIAKKFSIRFSLMKSIHAIPEVLREGFILYSGSTFGGSLYSLVCLSLITQYIKVEEYNFVRIGLSIGSFVNVFVAATQPVTFSFLSESASHVDHEKLKSFKVRVLFSIIVLIVMWLIAFNDLITTLLFGRIYMDSKVYVSIILVILLVQVINQFYTAFLVARGLANFIGFISVLCVGISIISAIVLIPYLGLLGYLISFSSGYIIGLGILFRKENQVENYKDKNRIKVVFISSFFMVFTTFALTYAIDYVSRFGVMVMFTLFWLWLFRKIALLDSEFSLMQNKFSEIKNKILSKGIVKKT